MKQAYSMDSRFIQLNNLDFGICNFLQQYNKNKITLCHLKILFEMFL